MMMMNYVDEFLHAIGDAFDGVCDNRSSYVILSMFFSLF
jgi:hypothetical protein